MLRCLITLLLILMVQLGVKGQISSECTSAVPICYNTPINGGTNGYGGDDFNGAASSGCLERTNSGAIESNSAWYYFRTNASGQLGINIGHDASEDWDFALYQSNDCNNLGEPVRCNFFDNRDENTFIGIGEDPTGDASTLQYEDWLTVAPGQDYYLLINNFSNINSGFSIQFSGQIFETNPYDALDCSIISNLLGPPIAACTNETVTLDATTPNALNYVWYQDIGNGFEELAGQTVAIFQPLQSAMYRVLVVTSTEQIISEVQVVFSPPPITNIVENEITCENEVGFDLSVKDTEALGNQSSSDNLVTYHSSQSDAVLGINELPKQYISLEGVENIYIRISSIQNPDCFDASSNFQLTTIASPFLGVDQEIYLCGEEFITIGDETPNSDYKYSWSTGEITSTISIAEPGTYTLSATTDLGNVFCVRTQTFEVYQTVLPEISEVLFSDFSFENTVQIIPRNEGNFEYKIDGEAYQDSSIFEGVLPGIHTLYMRDVRGCGEAVQEIAVVGYPSYFSPNGDGVNDYWQVMGLEYLNDPIVSIFDRNGKMLKTLDSNSLGWNGTYNNQELPGTDYWFQLSFVNEKGNKVKAKFLKNHFTLKR